MTSASTTTTAPRPGGDRAVALWLLAVAALVVAMVVVGGATRLTESGLSIVEWRPVTGTLPPLSAADWQAAFEQYQTIPQYQHLNRGMTLAEFKTIFWWEWAHRLLGRVIGAAFLLPFLYFLWRGRIELQLQRRLWGIFALGALQGAVGWWMVVSGLTERVEVSQYRLAVHLVLACLILAAVLWTACRILSGPAGSGAPPTPRRLAATAGGLILLVLLQIYLGALVAGLRGGLLYNTWPLMDGALIPPSSALLALEPAWRNAFENILTVQFLHRMSAYVLWVGALLHAADARRAGGRAFAGALLLAMAVTAQAALGILTLLAQAPLALALAHQAMAVAVLAIAVIHAGRLAPVRTSAAEQGAPAVAGAATQPMTSKC
jgi:heme a synthase